MARADLNDLKKIKALQSTGALLDSNGNEVSDSSSVRKVGNDIHFDRTCSGGALSTAIRTLVGVLLSGFFLLMLVVLRDYRAQTPTAAKNTAGLILGFVTIANVALLDILRYLDNKKGILIDDPLYDLSIVVGVPMATIMVASVVDWTVKGLRIDLGSSTNEIYSRSSKSSLHRLDTHVESFSKEDVNSFTNITAQNDYFAANQRTFEILDESSDDSDQFNNDDEYDDYYGEYNRVREWKEIDDDAIFSAPLRLQRRPRAKFLCSIRDSVGARKWRLRGDAVLEVSEQGVSIVPRKKSQFEEIFWPLQHIKKYGDDLNLFSMEIGHLGGDLAGVYFFEMDDASAAFDIMNSVMRKVARQHGARW